MRSLFLSRKTLSSLSVKRGGVSGQRLAFCAKVRRDNREKKFVSLEGIEASVKGELDAMTPALFDKAFKHREERTYNAETLDELVKIASEKSGYIRAMWCGELACELKLKEDADVTSRCIPFGVEATGDKCVCCGKPAKHLVYWGKAY